MEVSNTSHNHTGFLRGPPTLLAENPNCAVLACRVPKSPLHPCGGEWGVISNTSRTGKLALLGCRKDLTTHPQICLHQQRYLCVFFHFIFNAKPDLFVHTPMKESRLCQMEEIKVLKRLVWGPTAMGGLALLPSGEGLFTCHFSGS